MNAREFVKIIIKIVHNTTISGMLNILDKPPGRSPNKKLLNISHWYNSISQEEKEIINSIIQLSVRQTIFGFLSVLDGVRQIESDETKGWLELKFLKNEYSFLINDPAIDFLHDIFNEELSSEDM